MRYVTISIDQLRAQQQRRMWPDLEVFPGVTGCGPDDYRVNCIPQAYRNVARSAVEEGWGRETIVMQDDVWMPHGPGFDLWNRPFWNPLVVYGQREHDGRVAPKAFSATPEIWLQLQQVWNGTDRVIPSWQPIVEEHGLVLDVTRNIGWPASTGCRGCGH